MKYIPPTTTKGPAEWFSGDVYPTIILLGEEPSRVRVGRVHFTPGARTAWHSHALGQYLHVIEGVARVQERGGDVKEIQPGETIYTAPNIEHWHGATIDTFMVNLAIWEGGVSDEPETKWMEHVKE